MTFNQQPEGNGFDDVETQLDAERREVYRSIPRGGTEQKIDLKIPPLSMLVHGELYRVEIVKRITLDGEPMGYRRDLVNHVLEIAQGETDDETFHRIGWALSGNQLSTIKSDRTVTL